MTKELIISKLEKSLQTSSNIIYSYIGGSFNTSFFQETSDIDVVLISKRQTTLSERCDILERIRKAFKTQLQWSFLDTCDLSPRDAISFLSFRKIEIYHYDLETFQNILLNLDSYNGLEFSLLHRVMLKGQQEMDIFIDSFLEQNKIDTSHLYFSIRGNNDDRAKQSEDIVKLFASTLFNSLPSKKHLKKLTDLIPDGYMLKKHQSEEWLKKHSSLVMSWSSQHPEDTIQISSLLEVKKHDSNFNAYVLETIIKQKERLSEFLSWPKNFSSIEDQNNFSFRASRQWQDGTAFHFQIFYRDLFAGAISIHSMDYEQRSFQYGYWINEAFEGYGLLHCSLKVINQDMKRLGWKTGMIKVKTSNSRSIKVAEKIGMTLKSSEQGFYLYSVPL